MSLAHALLTALTEKSGSGLDLARRFDRSIGFFWQASHQQIYRELSRMEAAGLIEARPEPDSRGQRKLYRVLPKGRAALRQWVAQGEDGPPLRDALMVRLRAEAVLGDCGLADVIDARLAGHREMLAQYRAIEARDFTPAPTARADALRHLVLQAGIRHEENWIALLETARPILREG